MEKQPDILVTRADKGNVTVLMNRADYNIKMEQLLSDNNTYEIVKKDPTKVITRELRSLLTKWFNKKYIDHTTYKRIYCSDSVLPRAHGLPKIHKEDHPLRIIVSSINSPLYNFSWFLQEVLATSILKSFSHIKKQL